VERQAQRPAEALGPEHRARRLEQARHGLRTAADVQRFWMRRPGTASSGRPDQRRILSVDGALNFRLDASQSASLEPPH
jgi:hypothetical protein